jgi:Hydroxyethylthiazole kinase family
MTGKDDYVSNGEDVYKLSNGSELLGRITGGGCMVGSVVAAFCGVESGEKQPFENRLVRGSMLLATMAGLVPCKLFINIPEGILTRAAARLPACWRSRLLRKKLLLMKMYKEVGHSCLHLLTKSESCSQRMSRNME